MLRPFIPRRGKKLSSESGVTIALVALAMFSIVAMAGLSIDIGTLYQANAEAQRAADAAALAGAKTLSLSGMTGDPLNSAGQWAAACTAASEAATTIANANTVGGSAPSTVTVTFLPGNVSSTGCSSESAVFGVNPMVNVVVTQANLPTYFSRIWGQSGHSVSATATAEAFNSSGSAAYSSTGSLVPVQPRCVKPLIVPNWDPGNGTCTGGSCGKFVNPDGSIVNPGVQVGGGGTGVIGESFNLSADCNATGPCAPIGTPPPPPTVIAPSTLQYLPGQVVGTPAAVPSCASDAYQSAIAGCDQTTPYQCGVQASSATNPSYVDLTENPGGTTGDTITGGQCLVNPSTRGADSIITTTYPYEIQAGAGNPTGLSGFVSTSNSIATIPIYDGAPLAPNPANQAPVTIVGFLQVFINPIGSGNPRVTVMNVVGCGNAVSSAAPPVYGSSPVPVRLITPAAQ